MLKTLSAGMLVLALAAAPALATNYTVSTFLTNQGYVDLGPGPADVQVTGPFGASFIISDMQPPATSFGARMDSASPIHTFCQTSHIWGLGLVAGSNVTVTPTSCGGGGGGGGSGGGTVSQGAAASAAGAWPMSLSIGGAAMSATNGLFVNPATGATFPVSGTVSILNFPATQPVSAAALPLPANAAQETGGNLAALVANTARTTAGASAATAQPVQGVSGGVPLIVALNAGSALSATQSGSWTVAVSNLPATQAVSGGVSVTNFPATTSVVESGAWTMGLTGTLPPFSSTPTINLGTLGGAATAALQPALNGDGGSLAHVTNFPATQTVAGTVSVSNFPATQAATQSGAWTFGLTGTLPAFAATPTFNIGTAPAFVLGAGSAAIGSVTVSNLPATQAVSGTFWQATQPVSLASVPTHGVNAQGSASSTYANSHGATSALAASLVLKASAGNLYSVNATAITGGAAGYLVVINATSAPTNGAAITPLDFCYFGANPAGCSLSHGHIPINYSAGMVALITTAASPYTYTSGTDTGAISGDFQ